MPVTDDRAFDGEPTDQTISIHCDVITAVIPPRDTAVPGAEFEVNPPLHDIHLLTIASLGRPRWQEVLATVLAAPDGRIAPPGVPPAAARAETAARRQRASAKAPKGNQRCSWILKR